MLKKSRLATFAIGLLSALIIFALVMGGLGMLNNSKRDFNPVTLQQSFESIAELSVEQYNFAMIDGDGEKGREVGIMSLKFSSCQNT